MKKAVIFDTVVIIILAIILVVINELDSNHLLFKYRYVGFLIVYFVGRYISKLIYK